MISPNIDKMGHTNGGIIGLVVGLLVAMLIAMMSNLAFSTKMWLFLWLTVVGGVLGTMMDSAVHGHGFWNFLMFSSLLNVIGNIVYGLFEMLGA
jgi:uncharacterized membrane protein